MTEILDVSDEEGKLLKCRKQEFSVLLINIKLIFL